MISTIDRLFGSRTRATLLCKLLMNPDRSFYLRELSRELGIPYSMVYKEEKNLVSLGIVEEEKRGPVTLVAVNKKLPYFSDLRGLVTKTVGLGEVLGESLSKVKGIHYALVYGSFAGGEYTESSDVDLLVVGDVQEENLLREISQAENVVNREINYILWSDEEFASRVKSRHHLLSDLVNKPVIMLQGDEDEFRRVLE